MKRIIATFLIFLSTVAFANPIKHIVFLGDSLTDDGNLFRELSQAIPAFPPYFNGRFSNGYTWAEQVGKYYYEHNNISYRNYAFGGATAKDNIFPALSLSHEVDNYLNDKDQNEIENNLFIMWIGANDYLNDTVTDANILSNEVLQSIESQVTRLVDAGAKEILLINLPDVTKGPFGVLKPDLVKRIKQTFGMHNDKLKVLVATLTNKFPNVRFQFEDINTFWTNFLNDPEIYNKKYDVHIKNIKDSCLSEGIAIQNMQLKNNHIDFSISKDLNIAIQYGEYFKMNRSAKFFGRIADVICDEPNSYVFWDPIHPTEAAHKVVANVMIEKIGVIGK